MWKAVQRGSAAHVLRIPAPQRLHAAPAEARCAAWPTCCVPAQARGPGACPTPMSSQARPVRTRRQGAHGGRLGGHTAHEGALLGTAETDLGLEPEGDGGSLHLAHHPHIAQPGREPGGPASPGSASASSLHTPPGTLRAWRSWRRKLAHDASTASRARAPLPPPPRLPAAGRSRQAV